MPAGSYLQYSIEKIINTKSVELGKIKEIEKVFSKAIWMLLDMVGNQTHLF